MQFKLALFTAEDAEVFAEERRDACGRSSKVQVFTTALHLEFLEFFCGLTKLFKFLNRFAVSISFLPARKPHLVAYLVILTLGISGCIAPGPHGGPGIGIPGYGWLWYPGIEKGYGSLTPQEDKELIDNVSGTGGRTVQTALIIRHCRSAEQMNEVERWCVGAFGKTKDQDDRKVLTVNGHTYDVITYSRCGLK